MAPQALAYYPGIERLISASVTLSHGITPGAYQLSIAPQASGIVAIGDLMLTYDRMRLVFPDCKADEASFAFDQSQQIIGLTILDRRWKWAFGQISGNYNVRLDNGKIVKKDKANASAKGDAIVNTERTPHELAKLCFEAMGERNYDLGDLPNDARPNVEWEGENPAKALADLCEDLGCRIVLQLNNTVKICRVGHGLPLPLGQVISISSGLNPPEQPDAISVLCGRNRYQGDFELEAVGEDKDEQIKLIDDLSYKPVGGWEDADIKFLGIADKKLRDLAQQSVFRWYRIKTPCGVPGYDDWIDDLQQILPIEDVQVETVSESQKKRSKDAVVYGVWFNKQLGAVENALNNAEEVTPLNGDLDPRIVPVSYSIDTEKGIVKFSEAVYKVIGEIGDRDRKPADLRLRVAVSVRDKATRAWIRHERTRKKKGFLAGTQNRYIKRDEIILAMYATYSGTDFNRGKMNKNLTEVNKEADYYLVAAEKEYQIEDPESATYAGWLPINPDGALQCVSWSTEISGPVTKVSRNQDLGTETTVAYKLRRNYEKGSSASDNKKNLRPSRLRADLKKAQVL